MPHQYQLCELLRAASRSSVMAVSLCASSLGPAPARGKSDSHETEGKAGAKARSREPEGPRCRTARQGREQRDEAQAPRPVLRHEAPGHGEDAGMRRAVPRPTAAKAITLAKKLWLKPSAVKPAIETISDAIISGRSPKCDRSQSPGKRTAALHSRRRQHQARQSPRATGRVHRGASRTRAAPPSPRAMMSPAAIPQHHQRTLFGRGGCALPIPAPAAGEGWPCRP